jgi:hypothetical protein
MSSSGEFLFFVASLPALWQVPRVFAPVRMNSGGTHFTGLYRRYSVRTHTGYASDITTRTDKLQTGSVRATGSGMVTGGMYSGQATVHDNRVTHEKEHTKFFLTDESGATQSVDTVNVRPTIGEGHVVSVAWLVHGGKTGNAFLVYNHTTNEVRAEPVRLGWLMADRGLAKMVLRLRPGYMILMGVLIVTFPLLLLFVYAAKWHVRRFVKRGAKPLYSAMQQRARELPQRQRTITIPTQAGPAHVIDLAGQMDKISALHNSGALTDDEFQAAKGRLLGST